MHQCFNLAALVMTRATIASLGTAMLLLRPDTLSLPDETSGSDSTAFDDVSWISTCMKVLLWRQTVMAVLLAIPALVLGARGLLGSRKAELVGLACVGGLALAANNVLWAYSVAKTSLVLSYLLGYIHPPFMVLVVCLMGRRVYTGEVVGVAIVMGGA